MDRNANVPSTLVDLESQQRLQIQAALTGVWSELLGVPQLSVHDDFFQLGGDPERGKRLLQWVKREFQAAISLDELYEARTISKLADLIGLKQTAREQHCIVPIRREGYRTPLFLVHGVGGNVLGFASLARSLKPGRPVYGIQAQALQQGVPTLLRLEEMASYYVAQLRQQQPLGPYALLGFSFGGLVAYEMAQQLAAAGQRVCFLGMLDTWQPGYMQQMSNTRPRVQRTWDRLNLVRLNTRKLSSLQMLPYLYSRIRNRMLRAAYARLNRSGTGSGAVSLPESMRKVRDINLIAGEQYRVTPYPGRITLFRARDDSAARLPEDLEWRRFARGGVELVALPGDHGQILAEPNLGVLAARLEECLAGPAIAVNERVEREEFELGQENLVRVERLDTAALGGMHPVTE